MNDHRRCDKHYRELISGYIDGDLTPDERQELLQHLASCQECRQTLEAYRQIGGRLRSLPPVTPPAHLRDAIYAETIDDGSRRIYIFASRVGYGMAALAAVALIFIVAIYLLVSGYQRSIDPEVIGSEPVSNVIWPLHKPIEITFNKEMDRESVESALSISPASEKERLRYSWDGNTLVLGENQTLQPGASYTIKITDNAKDEFGNRLEDEFKLQFRASDSIAQIETPVPLPTPTLHPTMTPSPEPTSTDEPTEERSDVPSTPSATPTPDASNQENSPAPDPDSNTEPPAAPTDPPPPPENGPTEPQNPPTSTPVTEPDPTATPTPLPQPTSTPEPTATPEPAPTETPVPSLTEVEPTPTEEPLPTETPTPDAIPVVGAFGNVYWGNELVQSRLGEPLAAAASTGAIELDFQHGGMFLREDSATIYVLESNTGVWSAMQDTGGDAEPLEAPVEGTWMPGGRLGALWTSESWIQDALGYALAPEGTAFESRAQNFSNGAMLLSSSGQIYVVYDDGTWELYPDPGS